MHICVDHGEEKQTWWETYGGAQCGFYELLKSYTRIGKSFTLI